MTAVDDVHGATATNSAAGAQRRALTRAELVESAATQWRDELAALVGRDPLLSYRDLKVGTLDLAAAEPDTRKALLDGEPVFVSKLFPHEPLRSSALRSARAIRDTASELWEERGITACTLAVGIATWSNPFAAHRPAAPVLLRAATISARDPAETDFRIVISGHAVINPVLLHALDSQLGLRFAVDDLLDAAGQLKYPTVVERLREFAPAHVIDGFSIAHRAVVSTFSAEPLLLSDDVGMMVSGSDSTDSIAALAGDEEARVAVAKVPRETSTDFVAFDLDDDQTAAVAAVAAGACVTIDAPPGSGRTQTVAAAVAELVGRGKSVLVVNPKRSAVDDLMMRLRRASLADIAVDIGAVAPPDAVNHVSQVAKSLVDGESPAATADPKHQRLLDHLVAYRDAVHRRHEPWGSTVYEGIAVLAATPARARTSVRVEPEVLARVGDLGKVQGWVREYAELGGLTMTPDGSPWHGSSVATEADAAEALATVTHLHKMAAPALRDAAVRAAVEVGLAGPTSLDECLETVDLLKSVATTIERFGPDIWDESLDDLIYVTGNARYRRGATVASLGYFARRRLRTWALGLAKPAPRATRNQVHHWLVEAREQLAGWKARSRGAKRPRTGPHLPSAIEAAAVVRARLDTLARVNERTADIPTLDYAAAGRRFASLLRDQEHVRAIPRLRELEAKIDAAGMTKLIDDLRGTHPSPERLDAMVAHVWHASLLDRWCREDDVLAEFDAATHERLCEEFRDADEASLAGAAAQVLAARHDAFARACEDHEGQAAVISEMGPEPAVATTRALLEAVPDLALAAVPCWVMSPYDVAACLPPRRLFDVVIVDGAGRLPVAHAVPAIARGSQVVIVRDDDAALGPITVAADGRAESDDSDGPFTEAPPYTLADALGDTFPLATLGGRYRVRDDQLALAPATIFGTGSGGLVPSAWEPGRLRREIVDVPDGDDGPVDSSAAEVARVVELVLEHLRSRPHESLGVVTVSAHHAWRVNDALRRALVREPDVASVLDESRAEPFFVKNVERVGGDSRDAIILSLGYGRSVDGRILYRFGAVGRPGGERRLGTAVTRARERLTVVSTFGAHDLSERRLTTPGPQALGRFLAYVAAPGRSDELPSSPDPLAHAIADRLRAAGADVEVGYGGSAGVAVAARHPTRKSRFVLAVETDGPASAGQSVREADRVRAAHLRRLGWSVHRVWSMAWSRDPDHETRRLVRAYERAVADADAYDWAVAAAEADIVAGMPDDSETTEPADAEDASADSPREREGRRPHLIPGLEIVEYGSRALAALARWVESDREGRSEDSAVCLLAAELGNAVDDVDDLEPRAHDMLRHAVRVARAGAPAHL